MSRKWDEARGRGGALGDEARRRWAEAEAQHASVGTLAHLFHRDQAALGSVMGSAIALRLFLFVVPANVALVSLVHVLRLGSVMDRHLESSVTTGTIATALRGQSWWGALGVLFSSVVLTLWAGRTLARMLGAASGAAWGMTFKESKVRPVAILALSGVFFAVVLASSVFSRLRDHTGVVLGLASWSAVLGTVLVAWFAVMLALPRGTPDPGALLPGVVLVAVGYTVLEWFMQYYLPRKIARTSDTFGQVATTVATLGNFFFIGRLMSAGFVVSAVVYERHGTLSHVLFGLPLVRRLPARFPRLAAYFDLVPEP